MISVADGGYLLAPSAKHVLGTGHDGPEVILGRERVPVCAVRPERAVMCRIGEYSGSRESFVHPDTPNPPVSPNTPTKSN